MAPKIRRTRKTLPFGKMLFTQSPSTEPRKKKKKKTHRMRLMFKVIYASTEQARRRPFISAAEISGQMVTTYQTDLPTFLRCLLSHLVNVFFYMVSRSSVN